MLQLLASQAEAVEAGCRRGCGTLAAPGRERFHLIAPVGPTDAEFVICAGPALELGAVYGDPARPGEWVQVQSQPAPRRLRVRRACAGSAPRFHARGAIWTLVQRGVPWRVTLVRPRASTSARVLCPQGPPDGVWLGAARPGHRCRVWLERLTVGGFFAARLECSECGYAGPALVCARRRRVRPP